MTTTSPFQQGAVVQVAQGVLRGVGPMGPRGFTGPQGPPGPQGPQGLQPAFEPVAAQHSRAETITITNDGNWQKIGMTTTGYNVGDWTELLGTGEMRVIPQSGAGVTTLFGATVVCRPGAGGTSDFTIEIGVFAGASPTPFASNRFPHTTGANASTFTFTAQQMIVSTSSISIGVRILDSPTSPEVTYTSLQATSTGGPAGAQGEVGPEGPVGPAGPAGPPGDSGSGYSTLDGLDAEGNSSADPGTSMATNSQLLPYPTGSQEVKIPWFFKQVVDAVAGMVVRRFASAVDESGSTDRAEGQVYYLMSSKSLHVLTSDTEGNPVPSNIAQVAWSTSDPPEGVAYPAGTIWMKVT